MPALVLDGSKAEIDLGVVELVASQSVIRLRNQAKAAGTWPEFAELVGRQCPACARRTLAELRKMLFPKTFAASGC